ncbi:MAG: accessory Sec system translocase SecA2 [Lawsonella sp.]
MKSFSSFWKLFGASTSKIKEETESEIQMAEQFTEWAANLADSEFADAAHELDLLSDEAPEYPKFLALIREAADRSLKLRPFDVQLEGALRLLEGDVVEMATGEGKTLSGAIAAIGYALGGHAVHVISVNDYLARRDAQWMEPLFNLVGLRVGWINESSTRAEREAAYAADITYAPVNEIGFDVLRDQLVTNEKKLLSPQTDVVIVDEADSVLVDEALVPLVLAGATHDQIPSEDIVDIVRQLQPHRHFDTDAEKRNIFLTDEGSRFVEKQLGGINLYDDEHVSTTLVQVNVALHAHVLLQRDVHYIVRNNEVKLIDASRGRVAELQRWPDGLQAAVEAKEGLPISDAGEVLDTITVQALIGRYSTVCGMTGTAIAAGEQLRRFYDLSVSQIAPNKPCIRKDEPNRVYDTAEHKLNAIVEFIREVHETGQPILVGTQNVAESEELAELLASEALECRVLNAKNDAAEAAVIAEAGKFGAITVSTQMAGRGTDIRLGGSDEADRDRVVEVGGLCVIGTSRYHTERLDNQLRGRAGRQGDPGMSVFFASVEDDLVAAGAPDARWPGATDRSGQFTTKKAHKLIDHAQRVMEGQMLDIHAYTWRYSRLVADQRKIVSQRRDELLRTDAPAEFLAEALPEKWEEVINNLDRADAEQLARSVMLYYLDRGWADHLAYLNDVRESIHLRALGRQNPLDEYHRIAIDAFQDFTARAEKKAIEAFAELDLSHGLPDLDQAGMARPSSTWTYMVHRNPLAEDGDTGFSSLGGVFR